MVMVMVVSLLVGAAVALAGVGGAVADDELGAVALDAGGSAASVPVIVTVARLVEGLLAAQGRVVARTTGGHLLAGRRLVQVLPGLAVVAVQAAPATRRATVEARHGVAVGRCPVPVVLTPSAAVPEDDNSRSVRFAFH